MKNEKRRKGDENSEEGQLNVERGGSTRVLPAVRLLGREMENAFERFVVLERRSIYDGSSNACDAPVIRQIRTRALE